MTNYKYSGKELVERYKNQYSIPENAEITEEMVIHHWELEKELTRKLLASDPDNRWETFNYCYSILFSELDWLHKYVETKNPESPESRFKTYTDIIGKDPKHIYEIGSGKGELITYLASLGHNCRATEVSKERGEKHVEINPNISWSNSDGIHLEKFEKENSYDFVISNAVVEHLHPDDLIDHFKGVHYILKPGGKYIFFTIHKFYGPIDISRVFGEKKPKGMHLKEYMIYEFITGLNKVGYKVISFPYPFFTKKFYTIVPFANKELFWIEFIERILNILPYNLRSRILNSKRRIFPISYPYIIAEK